MTISLDGRTALITGVSSGLGEGVARVFAGYGAHVIGVARRRDRGLALTEDVRAHGGRMTFVDGDLTTADCRARAIDACLAETGRLDILVNNAGGNGAIAAVEDYPDDEWDRILGVNLTAVFRLCQLALPHMRRQRDGVILNIASINAKFGVAKMAAYCAAKAGLVHLTKVMAAETVDANVRANAIILGGVRSEMNATTTLAMARSVNAGVRAPAAQALERKSTTLMTPEDVASALAALCLPESALITGSEIAIDRGFTAGAAVSAMLYSGAASQFT